MTVNESLCAGTPVLVSNRCGAHELVRNDTNGYTFAPEDTAHLSALLLRLHNDPALVSRLRQSCAPSMEHFSIRQYVARHLEMLADTDLVSVRQADEPTNAAPVAAACRVLSDH
jgi:glycosyltransferase involved in cell wall biosynthesis